MNILIFSWRGPGHPNEGGAEQVTHEHAKAWIQAGHRVTLFTSTYPGAKENETIDGINVIRKGGQILMVQFQAFFWYLTKARNNFDLVIDHFHGIPFFTPLYVRIKKIAVIHEVAKNVWDLNPLRKPFNLIPKYIVKPLEPYIFKIIYRNTPFLTGSKSTVNDLIAWGIKKTDIAVINHGVLLGGIPDKLPQKNNRRTAIFLGALSLDKGIFDAIKVFSEINRKDESWDFWIVGKGDQEIVTKIKRMLKKNGIDNKTTLWGYVSNQKKFNLLAKSHVMVNTSIHEGWGLVNIEANAVDTPVFGYKVAGTVDSVRNGVTGILEEQGDVRALAYQIIKLVNDDKRYKEFQKRARKWSGKFTWKESTAKSLKFIESV